MIIEIEIDGDMYQCKRLSAVSAFELGHLLGAHNLLFLAKNPDNAYAIMAGLMSIPFNDAKKIAETITKGAVKVNLGGEPTPVGLSYFSDDITIFYRLAAELVIANFQKLSTYLLEESKQAEARAAEKQSAKD